MRENCSGFCQTLWSRHRLTFSCKPKSDCKVPCFAIQLHPHHILQSHFILFDSAHRSPNNNTSPLLNLPPQTTSSTFISNPNLHSHSKMTPAVQFSSVSSVLNWTEPSPLLSSQIPTSTPSPKWLQQQQNNDFYRITWTRSSIVFIYKPQAQNPADSGSEKTQQSCYRSLLPQKVSHNYMTSSQRCFNCFSIKWMVI